MKSTRELVEQFRALHGSDRKAAAALGAKQQQFSAWRNGEEFPTEERAETMALAVGVDVALALAVLRRDRAKSESVRQVWSKIAEGLAVIFLAVGATATAPEARAGFNNNSVGDSARIHIGQLRRRWLAALPA